MVHMSNHSDHSARTSLLLHTQVGSITGASFAMHVDSNRPHDHILEKSKRNGHLRHPGLAQHYTESSNTLDTSCRSLPLWKLSVRVIDLSSTGGSHDNTPERLRAKIPSRWKSAENRYSS
jgi:hypothetical protein